MAIIDSVRAFTALLGFKPAKARVAVLRLDGVIGNIGGLRRGLSVQSLEERIDKAFNRKGIKAVALVINSPGGAAAQSALIFERIRALRAEKDLPVIAFCEDVAASGGYMLALAADEIHAHAMSLVGSIGVVSAGFGFADALARLGVERRVYTAGENKRRLDPFLPEKPEDVERVKELQLDIHQGFKDMVLERRGAKLKAPPETLFTGDVWTGRQALDLGLVDGLGEMRAVLRARFGADTRFLPVHRRKSLLPWRTGAAAREGLAAGALSVLEARAVWSRFGL